MRYLVDTHAFLWWMTDPDKLSPAVLSLVQSDAAEIGSSSVSGWEIAIKSALGKGTGVPIADIAAEIEALGWSELRFSLQACRGRPTLPPPRSLRPRSHRSGNRGEPDIRHQRPNCLPLSAAGLRVNRSQN